MSIERKSAGVWQVSPGKASSDGPATRPRRRNTPRLPLAERREQLLDAALTVVARAGLAELTMQAVAKQAGVAKPVLYAVYPTAPELVGALLRREHARGMAQVLTALPGDLRGSDPDKEYVTAVMAFLDAVLADPVRWRLILLHADGAPSDYRELLADARDRIVSRCIELLETGFELRGGPVGADVELIGHTMLGFVEVLARIVLADPERFPPERLQSTVQGLVRTLPRSRDGEQA